MIPKASILLPVYNGTLWIKQCIESVLCQTFGDFELIVGDDGSTDGSRDLLAGYRDSRLRVFLYDGNVGLFRNLNRMLRRSEAPLVHFLCQDDQLERACLAEEVLSFEKRPAAAMSVCQVSVIDADGNEVGEWTAGGNPIEAPSPLALQLLFYHGCIAGNLSTMCVRRRFLDECGTFDESFRLAGDYDLCTRLCQRGTLLDLHQKLIRMRAHPAQLSLSAGAGLDFVRENRRIRANLIPLLAERIRPYARRYAYWRQNVLETHQLVRSALGGEWAGSWRVARTMGPRDLSVGIGLWLLTMNNHLYRPKPLFDQV